VTDTLTAEAVELRRARVLEPTRVVFRVSALYGLCDLGIEVPVDDERSLATGPIALTMDPDADATANLGVIDFNSCALTVRYGVQAVFPALYDLASRGEHDPGLLNPVRMVATDECTVTPNLMGWRALGCLDFLRGSVWSGATGG
jgi:hypothetical protein